ncbi:hypothetical protein KL86PLE_100384 [uncultured Pleomorphomonas sp.]|uniref:Uncharacterized protein n=1 Tax=uncultured Pleomorphomonas sp. TaxID=442121 RepID=A0A212L2X9_9HYPH|nr:hypothetical protein KL86PLE_100384 [uncultured Pleomorphomonas sp.]
MDSKGFNPTGRYFLYVSPIGSFTAKFSLAITACFSRACRRGRRRRTAGGAVAGVPSPKQIC